MILLFPQKFNQVSDLRQQLKLAYELEFDLGETADVLGETAPHLTCYYDFMDLNDMNLLMMNLGTLVSPGPCGVFYATWHQVTEV